MEKKMKFIISVFDKLLLKNGQIINFNTYDWGVYLLDGKTCIAPSHEFKDYVYGMDIPINKKMFEPIEVVGKVKIKCELRKKNDT